MCTQLYNSRMKMDNDSVPSVIFNEQWKKNLNGSFSCEEYDISIIIVNDIIEMYNN